MNPRGRGSAAFSETGRTTSPQPLAGRYRAIRRQTERLCEPLAVEDYVAQSMPDASPVKWHLAHTTWFWETFVLTAAVNRYRPVHPEYGFLFNSYYVSVGDRPPRPERGLLTRPTVAEVYDYRRAVDDAMLEFLSRPVPDQVAAVVELGLNHEQQHQELILTDLKHLLGQNPLRPAYRSDIPVGSTDGAAAGVPPFDWTTYDGGTRSIGHDGDDFSFDNERPRHQTVVAAFALADRPATNGEFLGFIEDGGYRRPELWLSDGWEAVQSRGWQMPQYWERRSDGWWTFTLGGMRPLDPLEPVCHLSYFEADAWARWAGARLPTETEWETAASEQPVTGHFAESGRFHPCGVRREGVANRPSGLFGGVWEWTASAYTPYPGFRTPPGALGEYNGKFMCGQLVLRGGSCVTPACHIRATYRNFFRPDARWQFSGVRLARDET